MKFLGQAHRSMDAKGRLILPPSFKDILLSRSEDGVVVLTLFEGHIIGMTPQQWEKTMAALESVTQPGGKIKNMMMALLAEYEEVTLDGQGRLPLSIHKRKSGRLMDREVVVLGTGPRFEIWSEGEYEAMLAETVGVTDELAESNISLPFLGGGDV